MPLASGCGGSSLGPLEAPDPPTQERSPLLAWIFLLPLPSHAPSTNSGSGLLEDRGALGGSLDQADKGKGTPSPALQPRGRLLPSADAPGQMGLSGCESHSRPVAAPQVCWSRLASTSPLLLAPPTSHLVAGISAICLVVRGPAPVSGK